MKAPALLLVSFLLGEAHQKKFTDFCGFSGSWCRRTCRAPLLMAQLFYEKKVCSQYEGFTFLFPFCFRKRSSLHLLLHCSLSVQVVTKESSR